MSTYQALVVGSIAICFTIVFLVLLWDWWSRRRALQEITSRLDLISTAPRVAVSPIQKMEAHVNKTVHRAPA